MVEVQYFTILMIICLDKILKIVLIILIIILIRVTVVRLKLESLGKIGWIIIIGLVLTSIVFFNFGYYLLY